MKEGQVVHKCNVCDKLGLWDENWSWTFEFKNVYGMPHEYTFKMCSNECQQKHTDKKFSDKRRFPDAVKKQKVK